MYTSQGRVTGTLNRRLNHMNMEQVACQCMGTTVGDIAKAIEGGAKTYEEIQEEALMGKRCGGCEAYIRVIINALLK